MKSEERETNEGRTESSSFTSSAASWESEEEKEETQTLSQWQLMWRNFKKHRLAIAAVVVLGFFYLIALTCGFVAPNDPHKRYSKYIFVPPQIPRFIDAEGQFHFQPFVYGLKQEMDPVTWERTYVLDKSEVYPLKLFVKGDPYKFLGLFQTRIHLFGTGTEAPFFMLGSDDLGRDLFSRVIYGARISLSIGLIGVFMGLILGMLLGGASGLYGGVVDMVIQRTIEILRSIPKIPLWMGLFAALPASWSPIKVYFAITILLSLVGWTDVARVVRGKFLSLREEDFVMAAHSFGTSQLAIIVRHLIPNFISYVLVRLTLSIPWMILGETQLSFLGIGLRPPVISWGVLLQQAQNMRTVSTHPWLLLPGFFVVVAVLAFNFVGDGLRDAADPYSALRGK